MKCRNTAWIVFNDLRNGWPVLTLPIASPPVISATKLNSSRPEQSRAYLHQYIELIDHWLGFPLLRSGREKIADVLVIRSPRCMVHSGIPVQILHSAFHGDLLTAFEYSMIGNNVQFPRSLYIMHWIQSIQCQLCCLIPPTHSLFPINTLKVPCLSNPSHKKRRGNSNLHCLRHLLPWDKATCCQMGIMPSFSTNHTRLGM